MSATERTRNVKLPSGPQKDDFQEDGTRHWLREKVYEPKVERTLELVMKSVDALRERGDRVSLSTIVAVSKELDDKSTGVAQTTILKNEQAYAYYLNYRTYKPTKKIPLRPDVVSIDTCSAPVKLNRDLRTVKKRYMKMSKRELVDKLVFTEQGYASLHKDWVNLNQQLFFEISEKQDDNST